MSDVQKGTALPPPRFLWRARCDACAAVVERKLRAHDDAPPVTFCPVCRAKNAGTPGVLTWGRANA